MPLNPEILEMLNAILKKDPNQLTETEKSFLNARRGYLNAEQVEMFRSVLTQDESFLDEAATETVTNEEVVQNAMPTEPVTPPTPEAPADVLNIPTDGYPTNPPVEAPVTDAPVETGIENAPPLYPEGTPTAPPTDNVAIETDQAAKLEEVKAAHASETIGETTAEEPVLPVDVDRDHSKDPDYNPQA